MNNSQIYFQNLELLFRKYALPAIRESQEYQHSAGELKKILLLADRVIAASVETVETGRVKNIADKLSEINSAEKLSNQSAEDLLRDIEIWLKAILYLTDPVLYSEKKEAKNFTLNPIVKELNLLSEIESQKDINNYTEIHDPVRKKILLAYRYRNPLTHSPQDWPETVRADFISYSLVTLIAPVILHYDKLFERLKGLISTELGNAPPDVIGLLRLFEGERRKHLEIFGGRVEIIQEIQNRLEGDLRDRGAYLLVTGLEGIGKSAICAKLIEKLTEQISPIGRYSEEVKKHVSWLPGIIFHSGKQSKAPIEIAKTIIVQANTMLISPVDIDFSEWEFNSLISDYVFPYDLESENKNFDGAVSYNSNPQFHRLNQTQSYKKPPIPLSEKIRREIYSVLELVVNEYGSVMMIIDALDEISSIGKDLTFFPETLPPGVSALLTTRDNTNASQFMTHYCDNFKVRLNKLRKEEIPLIVKSDQTNQDDLALLHKSTWEKSRGWPIIVADAARKAKFATDIRLINIDKTPFELFERQASEWIKSVNNEILFQLLLLLAVFEPACPLEIGFVQGFLEYLGYKKTQAQIRDIISPVGYQIEGLSEGRIKLGFKAFAEHIRDSYLSKRDLRDILEKIVNWFINEEDLDPKTVGAFLSYWADLNRTRDHRIKKTINTLNESIQNVKDADFIYAVFRIVIGGFDKSEKMQPYMEDFLQTATEKGNKIATLDYSIRLFTGRELQENIDKSVHWLKKRRNKKLLLLWSF